MADRENGDYSASVGKKAGGLIRQYHPSIDVKDSVNKETL
jgi:hypothetical protein